MNFVGPDNQVSLTGSGTWLNTMGSVMNLAFYDDQTDTGLATAAQLVGSFTSPAALDPFLLLLAWNSHPCAAGCRPVLDDRGMDLHARRWR